MLLTVKNLSAWINVKPSTLYLWATQGKIPCRKIHGLIRFDPEVITFWLRSFDPASGRIPSSIEATITILIWINLLKQQNVRFILPPARNQTKSGPNKEVDDGSVSARSRLVDGFFLSRETSQEIHGSH